MKTKMKIARTLVSVSIFSFAVSLFAQGNLTPPGVPAATMKSLDQIEARTIVNSNNTPGDALSLFKITNPGAYYLTANITGVAGLHGITITAPNVSLDLNGFSLIGVPGSLNGINATNAAGATAGLTVRNGTVRNWGLSGIDTLLPGSNVAGAPGSIFNRLLLQTNDTTVLGGGIAGLRAAAAVVSECMAQGNSAAYGFDCYGSRIFNCVASYNDQGFGVFVGCTLEGCAAYFNADGVDAGDSTVANCTLYGNSVWGLYVRNNCRLIGNLVDGNGGSAIGIYLQGNVGRNTVDGNVVVNNGGAGITLTNVQPGNLVIRNTARGNGTNYLMGTGNSFGPIINVSGIGDISSNTNTLNPWANFSY